MRRRSKTRTIPKREAREVPRRVTDFAQAGLITTLPRLNRTHLAAVEAELLALSERTPIGLVLPCRSADLAQPALAHIASEISGAGFLAVTVLSINGVAPHALPDWARGMTILWNEAGDEAAGGKGDNVAAAFRHLATDTQCAIFAVQDCDVTSFRREDLARLCYAVAHPRLGFRFAKMYYSRATDRLYGRVSRLFFAPLLAAIERVSGRLPLIPFLRSFRYPLAGEVALTRELAMILPAQRGWTLEVGQLCEVHRRVEPREVCEVEGGELYEHRHQPAELALEHMVLELGTELFRQLDADGLGDNESFRAATLITYQEEAALAIRRSGCVALMNGLPFDEHAEQALVATFAKQMADMPLCSKQGN